MRTTTRLLTLLLVLLFATHAWAWNDKGHMLIARLAWKELTPAERTTVYQILQRHPHFAEFLQDKKPEGFSEEEWVFMRAATWSDWVRSGPPDRRKYHMGPAHYINLSILAPDYSFTPPDLPQQNVVTQLGLSTLIAKSGNQEDRAVHLCWVFHLIGDIHQPLHCVTFYSPRFPKGDRGGNLAKAKSHTGSTIQLHSFWDGLMGTGTSVTSINNGVLDIEKLSAEKAELITEELKQHKKAEEWAKEGYELAKKYGYLDGKLNPANEDDKPTPADLPVLPEDYGSNAGKVARLAAAKAGKRLAAELRDIISSK